MRSGGSGKLEECAIYRLRPDMVIDHHGRRMESGRLGGFCHIQSVA
jgi:hypothetical protein